MPGSGHHLAQVISHVRQRRLTRVNATLQSPFRQEGPVLEVLAKCPECGPRQVSGECGNSGAGSESNFVTSLDVSPSSVSTRRSQWSCASLRVCSSHAFELHCFSNWVLVVVFRETNGQIESKERSCTTFKFSRVGPTCRGSV